MDIYNFDDEKYINTKSYNNFIKENPEITYLDVRTSAASEAIPISGVRIVVSKIIDNNKIVFYDGLTDSSGAINNIKLPAPKLIIDDLEVPKGIIYDLEAIYEKDNIDRFYKILMYPNVHVLQNINIVPNMMVFGDYYGS